MLSRHVLLRSTISKLEKRHQILNHLLVGLEFLETLADDVSFSLQQQFALSLKIDARRNGVFHFGGMLISNLPESLLLDSLIEILLLEQKGGQRCLILLDTILLVAGADDELQEAL